MASILILEDEFLIASEWSDDLHKLGHVVTHVGSSSEAIEAAYQKRFDAIITDIFIERDGKLIADGGTSLISKIRNTSGLQVPHWRTSVPIIAVTGSIGIEGGFDPLQTAVDLGADLVLRKPFASSELVEALNQVLP